MRTIASFFVLNALLLVQTALSNFISFYGVKPDLPLVFIICTAIAKGKKAGALTGALNGVVEDVLFGRFLGLNAIAKSITGYIIGYTSRDLYKGRVIITMSMTFIGSVVFNLLYLLIAFFTGESSQLWHHFLTIAIPSALLNMIISPLFYFGVFKMEWFFNHYFDTRY